MVKDNVDDIIPECGGGGQLYQIQRIQFQGVFYCSSTSTVRPMTQPDRASRDPFRKVGMCLLEKQGGRTSSSSHEWRWTMHHKPPRDDSGSPVQTNSLPERACLRACKESWSLSKPQEEREVVCSCSCWPAH